MKARNQSSALRFSNENYNLTFFGMIIYSSSCLISMATMSIGAGILGACILLDRGGPRRLLQEIKLCFHHSVWFRSYLWSSFFLILACIVSLASARFYPLQFSGLSAKVVWPKDLAKMSYFLLPILFLIGWRRLDESQFRKCIQGWVISFGVFSTIGIPQFFSGWPRAQQNPLLPGFYHPILFLGHHLSVASIFIFPFFATLELIGQKLKSEKIGLSRGFLLYSLLCGLFVLILSYSRTLWVALPIGITVWILGRISIKKALVAISLLFLVAGAAWQTPYVQSRLQNPMGVSDRIELWKANWIFFQNRPIFGVGLLKNHELSYYYFRWLHPNQYDFFTGHAHNIYLEVLAGLGIFGAIAWLFWIGWVFFALKTALRSPSQLNFAYGILCAWIVLMMNGLTQVNFWEGKVLHQIMWSVGLTLFWIVQKKSNDHGTIDYSKSSNN